MFADETWTELVDPFKMYFYIIFRTDRTRHTLQTNLFQKKHAITLILSVFVYSFYFFLINKFEHDNR